METKLPPYVSRDLIERRLPIIFPEGTPNRTYCIRKLAASTVFAALYIGAIEGSGRFLGPIHVYRLTDAQAALSRDSDRNAYATGVLTRRFAIPGTRWYEDNTREPIRDETLRDGLVAIGAVTRRDDLPTTSGLPRYALKRDFAVLFDPDLTGDGLLEAIARFQASHLSKSALARVSIMLAGAGARESAVQVTFPNGERRHLAPGPSSTISKAVVETFAPKFLKEPAVLWLSESGNRIVLRDDRIAEAIGLKVEPNKNLPDMILADLGPVDPLILFVEIVATDGAITPRRQQAMLELTDAARFKREQVAFLTAYRDRDSPGFKRTVAQLAWRSFAWFTSEPDCIMILRNGASAARPLSELLNLS